MVISDCFVIVVSNETDRLFKMMFSCWPFFVTFDCISAEIVLKLHNSFGIHMILLSCIPLVPVFPPGK